MTRLFWTLIITTFVGMIAACGDSPTPATPTATAPAGAAAAAKTKVGLILVGSTSDGGWNQMGKEALDKLAASDNLEVRPRQQVAAKDYADAIRQFDSQGYALIICHGEEFGDIAKELTDPAKPNPVKTKIVVSGSDVDNPNFQSLNYDLAGASYQLGVVAGKVSKSGKFGFIGGEKAPALLAMQRGFEAGAKSVNPNATFATDWPGWDDPTKSKRVAEAFIAQGIDVIMQNVDSASRGIFEAVKENNAKNGAPTVYTFGANADQNANPICSDYTLGSAVIQLDHAFAAPVKQVKAGTFKGGIVNEDVASGVCVVVLNPKLLGKVIDKDTEKLCDEAGKKLAADAVKIPKE